MPIAIAKFWKRNGWSFGHLLGAIGMLLIGVYVTFDAWRDIARIAIKDEEASHIFLVPVVVAWLIWIRRRRLRQCRPHGLWVGTALIGLGWLFYWLGDARLVQCFWHGGAVLIVLGCVISIVGKDVLLRFMPAVIALAFLIPVPGRFRQRVAIPLGKTTAAVTQQIMEAGGVDVQRNGNMLSINKVDVTIAEACNGLRMVFALVMVCYAFAFGTPLRGYVRFIVLAATPFSAIFCNVIRLIPTLLAYGHFSAKVAKDFHDVSGWIMLLVAFLILMGILRLLRWAVVPVTPYSLSYE